MLGEEEHGEEDDAWPLLRCWRVMSMQILASRRSSSDPIISTCRATPQSLACYASSHLRLGRRGSIGVEQARRVLTGKGDSRGVHACPMGPPRQAGGISASVEAKVAACVAL